MEKKPKKEIVKKMIILCLMIILVTGCNKSNDEHNNNLKDIQNTNIEEKDISININEIIFPLYKTIIEGDNYSYVNNNVRANENIVIDNENKKVYDLKNSVEINYDEYSKNNPTHTVMNFVLLRNECKVKAACDNVGCSISNYGIQDLQYMIDSNGITPEYLLYEWCPIEISNSLVSELNNDGYKVWGRGLSDSNGKSTPLSIAIEFNNNSDRKILLEKYGLLDLFDTSPKEYFNMKLNNYVCNKYGLKCENKD